LTKTLDEILATEKPEVIELNEKEFDKLIKQLDNEREATYKLKQAYEKYKANIKVDKDD
jgi:uncharacterized protein (DUF1778 family)